MTSLYVYGLARSDRAVPDGVPGIGGATPRAVPVDSLVALVSDFDEHRELTVEDAGAHTSVLEAAFGREPVLPLRFATVVAGEEAVRDHVAERANEYVAHLDRLAGNVELEVRARYQEELVLRRILEENPGLGEMSRSLREGSAVDDQIELGEMVAGELETRTAAEAAALDQELLRIARARNGRQPAEGELLNAAYLVASDRIEDFVVTARGASDRTAWLSIDVAGPVPPYSFADPPEWADERQIWKEEEPWTSR